MASVDRPFPPGEYPLLIVGSGPGGIQTSYFLTQLGVEHAVISSDPAPGGMFRKYPFFQRLITWTKPFAPTQRGTREYEWHDWNTLITYQPEHRAEVADFMDGTSYFPSRAEMEAGIVAFAERNNVRVRYNCTWESTGQDADLFVLRTSDGEYRSRLIVFAVGVTQPWVDPAIEGIEQVPHYMAVKEPKEYEGKRIFIIGKKTSAFEVGQALLPWARKMIFASPSPVKISVLTHHTDAVRARYMQPIEDHALGGGHLLLDAAIPRIEKTHEGFRVHAQGTTIPGDWTFDVEEVVAATGMSAPMLDLAELGVAVFWKGGRLPRLTPHWESSTVPGIYFAGNASMGAIGLKKYGLPSNSAAVHGFRYNAKVMAEHIATKHFGKPEARKPIEQKNLVSYVLAELARAPELWNQQSYLSRIISVDPRSGIQDEGIRPLAHFLDADGPPSLGLAIETNAQGEIHPVIYVRKAGQVEEHVLPSSPLNDFEDAEYEAEAASIIAKLTG